MSIKQYEAFVKTAELGSLTRAAEALDSTQSRISHVLSAMEEEYGFCLMKRGRGGVSLTEAGALLLPKMEAVLRQNREVEALIADIRNADTGTVRLGAFTSVAVHWLPGMIQAFQALHPQVELKMFNGDYYDVAQWLRDGTVDLAFVTLPEPENTRAIRLPRLSGGEAEVSFGQLRVDLTRCEEIADGATVRGKCSFGELDLIVPSGCRVDSNVSTTLGTLETRGKPDPDAQVAIRLEGSVSFGQITVCYVD